MRREYFEEMYAANPDPWGFQDRWYEQRKYALTVAALSRPRYRSVFEPGCSIGVLSAQLALRCDRLLAVDLVESAVRQAHERLDGLPPGAAEVEVRQWDAAADPWPDGRFDLVVLSEMVYYLEPEQARRLLTEALGHLADDGEIVLVHWRPRVPEYPMTGDEAHTVARATPGLELAAHYEDDDLVLDVLRRSGSGSVAARQGLRDKDFAPEEVSIE
ncbi:MAG TPA: class I SAM-dependent methyltransferase [Lapillicoccus sp.]|nr:class I SAM-dependent methyltransferase [Lapillicoccus sp.]